jgi:uncharacterized protein (DUF2235 family)
MNKMVEAWIVITVHDVRKICLTGALNNFSAFLVTEILLLARKCSRLDDVISLALK